MLNDSESERTDLSDIGLCSINNNESLFNILLCYIRLGDQAKSASAVKKLENSCPTRYKSDIRKLKGIIARWGSHSKAENSNSRQVNLVNIEPFSASHRLCSYFPLTEFCLPTGEMFISRPSFSFPFVKPPNMIPNVDETLLFNEFGSLKTDLLLPAPQALWIKLQDAKSKPQETKPAALTQHY